MLIVTTMGFVTRVCVVLSLKGGLKMKCSEAHPSLKTAGGGYRPDSSRMGTSPRPCSQYMGHLCLPSAALLPLSHSQRRAGVQGGRGGARQGPGLTGAPTKDTIVHFLVSPPDRLSSNVKYCQILSHNATRVQPEGFGGQAVVSLGFTLLPGSRLVHTFPEAAGAAADGRR